MILALENVLTNQDLKNLTKHYTKNYNIFQTKNGFESLPPNTNTTIRLSYDTEYYTENTLENIKHYLTVQVKPEGQDNVYVFVHSDMTDIELPSPSDFTDPLIINQIQSGIINLKPLSDDSIPLIKMIECMSGYKVKLLDFDTKISNDPDKENYKPVLTVELIGFFHVVDLKGILYNEYDSSLWDSFIVPFCDGRIEYRKHLNSDIKSVTGSHTEHSIRVWDKVLRFSNSKHSQDYILRLKLTDICALVGHGSYANLAKIAGHKLLHKDDLTEVEKSDMLTTYRNKPDKVLLYAQGDCECIEIYNKFSKLIESVYESCDLPSEGVTAQKTIGSTVNKLLLNFLANLTGKNKDDIEKTYLNHTASQLKIYSKTTEFLLSVIYGGRCFSNQGLVSRIIDSVIVDIDIDGAYNSLLNSVLCNFVLSQSPPNKYTIPLKSPKDIRNRKNIDLSKGCTLREFLNNYNHGKKYSQLIPGLYQINVTSKSNKMKYKQDFFVSKFDVQIAKDTNNTDYLKEKSGTTKVFSHEVFNGIITENSLQLLLTDSNKDFVNYMLDNLIVVSASWYSPVNEVFSIDDLDKKENSWYRIPVSEISVLLQSLRFAHGKKSNLGIVFKYLANTIFGVFSSPYFWVSNPIVANNITDSIRVACYCIEKVMNGIKSITDGCQSDFNNIIVNRRKTNCLTMSNLVGVNNLENDQIHDKQLKKTTFLDKVWTVTNKLFTDKDNNNYIVHSISDGTKEYNKNDINKIIYDAVKDRYQSLPIFQGSTPIGNFLEKSINDVIITDKKILCQDDKNIKYLDPYMRDGIVGIDIKSVSTDAVFCGSANYLLIDNCTDISHLPENKKPDRESIAYRSFRKKGYKGIDDNNNLIPCKNPAKKLLLDILNDPCNVPIGEIYHKEQILMPNMYKENKTKFDLLGIGFGASYSMVGYIKLFSMSNFIYQNYDQYCKIKKDIDRHNTKYGQSLEMYFPGEIENTINVESMNKFFSDYIATGEGTVMSYLQKKIRLVESDKYHPNYHRLIEIKNIISADWINYKNKEKTKTRKVNLDFIELDFENLDSEQTDDYIPDNGQSIELDI